MSFLLSLKSKGKKHVLVGGIYDSSIHPREFARQFTGPEFVDALIASGKAVRLVGGLHVYCNSKSLCIGANYNGSMRIFRAMDPSPVLVMMLQAHTMPAARMILASYIRQNPEKKRFFDKSIQEDSETIPDDLFTQELNILDLKLVTKCPHLEIYSNLIPDSASSTETAKRESSPVRKQSLTVQ